ncbi:unnamed protein product [Onchocerca ochengi]|uniref:Transposase n=2 Tax=Onchocerca TaxID=6281 RepID=A0A182E184_ONCOC|nr:unnamed protein product [Onchocerca ochengi]
MPVAPVEDSGAEVVKMAVTIRELVLVRYLLQAVRNNQRMAHPLLRDAQARRFSVLIAATTFCCHPHSRPHENALL